LFNNIFKDKQVLITGHTGFKGAWLSIWLHELGAKITGYALAPPTQPCLFETSAISTRVDSTAGDVRNFEELRKLIKSSKPEIVFHLAAQTIVRKSYKDSLETYETNIMGTVNLLEACRDSVSVRVIVVVTSDKCYEIMDHNRGYKENDPIGGHDPYSSSKGCAELITAAYRKSYFNNENSKNHKISLVSVRAGNVIGGGDWAEDRLVPDCVKALAQKKPIVVRYPDAIRPWQHVLDPLYGYLLLVSRLYENRPELRGAWNFGPDDDAFKPVKWIVSQLSERWGHDVPLIMDQKNNSFEDNCLWLDSGKAKSGIGWSPKWSIATALQKTVEWYKAFYSNEADMFNLTVNQISDYQISIHK